MLRSQLPKHGNAAKEIADRNKGGSVLAVAPTLILRGGGPLSLRALAAYSSVIQGSKHAKTVKRRIAEFKRFDQDHPERAGKMPPAPRALHARVADMIRRHREALNMSAQMIAQHVAKRRTQYGFAARD